MKNKLFAIVFGHFGIGSLCVAYEAFKLASVTNYFLYVVCSAFIFIGATIIHNSYRLFRGDFG